MPDELVVIKTFSDEPAALVARSVLDANGIPSILSSDDAGRMEPPLQFTRGIRLIVRLEDATTARALLESAAD
ncbi:MAG TPA: hypothetical protein VGK99_18595 [Acidobacteriota bacterium]|jgi:hypothetical protein